MCTLSGLEDGCVSVSVHQLIEFSGVGELDFDHPALSVRIGVDGLGSSLESCVDLDYLAGYRHEGIGNCLNSLDGSENLFLVKGLALCLKKAF